MVLSMKRVHVIITGRVQGVFFRAHTRDCAVRLGLTGWVKNMPDGGVEAVAEGEEAELEKFAAWCRKGPPSAHVAEVKVERFAATGEFGEFGIIV